MINFSSRQKNIVIVFIAIILVGVSYKNYIKDKKEIYILSETNYEDNLSLQEKVIDTRISKKIIMVHVEGEVVNPGIYQLDEESRVYNAVEAAGGLKDTANRKQINLAKKIQDEEFIYIPGEEEEYENSSVKPNNLPSNIGGLININNADKTELESLTGIGTTLAERIIAYRNEKGIFTTIEEIQNVSGIGEKKFNDIKEKITVK
ncbi:helix-hairpin-helix domain-containing protein [Natronincola ferrireducens]|uniref:Competence protein ComEA n=1 Tax=Natronincola ferrireducens TaxID=393762 RepID=A0A1G9CZG0_9FIRM|nr:helix-hairpin-helix domain-containing protein [Natronincola ferrireducens]SDK57088.1 competence protein ComEA [Natronincola ferrireducens]